MSPSDPTPSARAPRPDDVDRLLDLCRGELAPRAEGRLRARIEADPALAAEEARLRAFLAAARSAQDEPAEPELAARISARVRSQVADEEAATRREELWRQGAAPRRRLLWGRILAVSVAVHVVLLGVLAWRRHQPEGDRPPAGVIALLPTPGLEADEPAMLAGTEEPHFPGAAEWGVPVVPSDPEPSAMLPAEELALAPLEDLYRDHPRAVALDMAVRRIDALKRRRLDRFHLDASGTLRVVSRGLDAIAKRQLFDGSFPAGGGRTELGQTALALLPFLAEGEGSRTRPDVVGRGVDWLRSRLFQGTGGEEPLAERSAEELGIALRALSEDYMLSYGDLAPAAARRRASELRRLASEVGGRQGADGSFPGADRSVEAAVWPMWGMEAAIRTGVVPPPELVPGRFQDWFRSTGSDSPELAAAALLLRRELGAAFEAEARARAATLLLETTPEGQGPFLVAISASGLFLHDPDTYRRWNVEWGDALVTALSPAGVVWRGDEVGDTALHLLALQAAYRTY